MKAKDKYIEILSDTLPPVFNEQMLEHRIKELFPRKKYAEDIPLRSRIFRSIKEIQIKWNKKPPRRQLFTLGRPYDSLDLIAIWTINKAYASHYSALYWNELAEQKPKEYFISIEIASHVNAKKNKINDGLLRLAFMKGARITQNFGILDKMRFSFIERADIKEIGVVEKKISFENRTIKFRHTDIERTLLDCVISPQYAGGMDFVVSMFSKANIDLEKMKKYYLGMGVLYPYWQNIGFILELTDQFEKSEKWGKLFGKPQRDFYFDRNARNDWLLSNKWRIFHPKGLKKA